jgi:hypothetical protein
MCAQDNNKRFVCMNILLIECQMDKHLILNLLYTCVNRHGATHVNHVIRTD